MLIFFDTEFTDLMADPKLISIGLVSEAGDRSFYSELSDTWQVEDANEFVVDTVIPLLEGEGVRMTFNQLRSRLTSWVEEFRVPVQLATDSEAWDWPWIGQLFKGAWPSNLDRNPFELPVLDPIFNDAFQSGFETGGLRQHHALDDARANRLGWLAHRDSNNRKGCRKP